MDISITANTRYFEYINVLLDIQQLIILYANIWYSTYVYTSILLFSKICGWFEYNNLYIGL